MRGQSDPELKKYLWVVIRTQKDRKLQTLIEVCTEFSSLSSSVNVHRPAEQTFAVEQDEGSEKMFAMMDRSQWTGQGFRSRPCRRRWHRYLPWLEEWGMKCDWLLAGRANNWDLHVRRSPPDRDIVNPFDRDATFPRSSASAAVKWDIRRLAAQSRIRRCHSKHRVGTYSQMDNGKRHLDRDVTRHRDVKPV